MRSVVPAVLVPLAFLIRAAGALSPPTLSSPLLGIGAVLFRPRGVKFVRSSESEDPDAALTGAGEFFVDAFWTGKVGGAKSLLPSQACTLERQQINEFRRRYRPGRGPGARRDTQSELVLCLDGRGECIGCAGVEVDRIKKMDGYDTTLKAPLMSNLAVSRAYRRRGLAEDLVREAESIARKEWGYGDVYLYVEKRNLPAVRLYRKMGYATLWEDDTATTLLPTEDGRVANGRTTIVCMRKRLGEGLFGSWFAR